MTVEVVFAWHQEIALGVQLLHRHSRHLWKEIINLNALKVMVTNHNFSPSFLQQNHPDPIPRPRLLEDVLAMMIDRNVVVDDYFNPLLDTTCQTKVYGIEPLLRYFCICKHFVDQLWIFFELLQGFGQVMSISQFDISFFEVLELVYPQGFAELLLREHFAYPFPLTFTCSSQQIIIRMQQILEFLPPHTQIINQSWMRNIGVLWDVVQ